MNSLYPDNAAEPHEQQPEGLAVPPPPPGRRFARIQTRPEFQSQPLPDRASPADSRTPFQWMDLVYLRLFYFVCGGVLTVIVAAGACVFFGISPYELKNSTAAWASVLIISQALLSGATLAFLYVMIRGRSSAPFWQTLGWRGAVWLPKHDLARLRCAALCLWRFRFGRRGRLAG